VDPSPPIGRADPCARLAAAVTAAAAGTSTALVLAGDVGSGRTTVLRWLAAHAADAPATVVGPVAAEPAPAPGALAGAVADALGAPLAVRAGGDAYELGAALLAALAGGDAVRPVVVLVDDGDAHDVRSIDALGFASRRLGTEGIVVVVATSQEARPASLAHLEEVALDPLAPDEAAAVFDRHAPGPVRADRRAAALELAAGRPLALVALAAHLGGRPPAVTPVSGDTPAPDPVAAAEEAIAAGRYGEAEALAATAEAGAVDEGRQVRALRVRVRARRALGAHPTGAGTLLEKATSLGPDHAELAVTVLTEAAVTDTAALRSGRAVATARTAVDLATTAAGVGSAATDLAHIALGAAMVLEGEVGDGRPHLDRWRRLLDRADLDTAALHLLPPIAMALIWAEDRAGARALLDRLVRVARQRRTPSVLPPALLATALLDYGGGDWDAAEAAAVEAADLATDTGDRPSQVGAAAQMALLAGLRGRTDECHRQAAVVLGEPLARRGRLAEESARSGLAAAALAAGRPDDVVAALAPLAATTDPRNPAPALWQADLVEAHLLEGRVDEARAVVADMDRRTARSGHRRGQGMVARLRSLLPDAADGEGTADVDATLARGFELLDDPPAPFARARLELTWGERLAAAGRTDEARHRLVSALRTFERLDARPWAARAGRGLERLGERPAPPSAVVELTPHERLVARALARGATIEQAAAELFLSPQTVARDAAAVLARLHVEAVEDLPARVTGVGGARTIEVRVLGRLSVRAGDEDKTPAPGQPATLVRYLAVRGGRAHVEELVDALWPTVDVERGRIRLRNVLARLRRTSPDLVGRDGADVVRWGDDVVVDLAAYEDEGGRALALARTDPAQAAGLARRALARLPEQPLLEVAYEPWATAPRRRVEARAAALLDLLATAAEQAGDPEAAADLRLRADGGP